MKSQWLYMLLSLILALPLLGCEAKTKSEEKTIEKTEISEEKELINQLDTITGKMQKVSDEFGKNRYEEGLVGFNEIHDYFHDIDPFVFEVNPMLARDLWTTMALIEEEIELDSQDNEKLKQYTHEMVLSLQVLKKEWK